MAAPKGHKHATKYNAKVHKAIVDAVARGCSKSDSFKLSGIAVDTGFDWLRYGRQNPTRYPEFVQLAKDIDHAQATVRAAMVDKVRSAADDPDPKSWTAAAWYLERTAPEDWGKRDQLKIEGGETPLVQLNQVVLVDGEAREQSRALLRRVAGLSTDEPVGIGMGNESSEVIEGDRYLQKSE